MLEFRFPPDARGANQAIVLAFLARDFSVTLRHTWVRISTRRECAIIVRDLTFVFFMRHLSQAFHTLLCLGPSPVEVGEDDEVGEGTEAVLGRLVTRCVGFVPALAFVAPLVALRYFETSCCRTVGTVEASKGGLGNATSGFISRSGKNISSGFAMVLGDSSTR